MSEYKTIFGKAVKALASDPTDAGAEGQIWYNTTTGSFRTVLNVSSWAATPSLNTGRNLGAGGGVTVNASIMTGGLTPARTANSEEYNGSSWTEGNNLPTATDGQAFLGTQTAAIAAEGRTPPANAGSTSSYSYNGTSWSSTNPTATASRNAHGAGTQTAGVLFGGYDNGPGVQNKTTEWDGTNWTNVNNMNAAREAHGGAGVLQTAALAFGGNNPPAPTTPTSAEEYNGTNWTTIASMTTGRAGVRGGTGTNTNAIVAGPPTATETWDGISWSTDSATLGTPRGSNQSSGIYTSALLFGGSGYLSASEEYSKSIYAPVAATWASGGNLNNNSQGRAGFGTQTTAVAGPGVGPGGGIATTENYDGSAWTNGASSTRSPTDLNRYVAGAGTPTAGAIASGGYPGTMTAATEEYDGSTWTAGGTMNTAVRNYVFDGATIASSLVTGGNSVPYPGTSTASTNTEEYNGTAWTSGGAMNTGRRVHSGSSIGSETASLVTAGTIPALTSNTEEYNGTSWTEVNNQPTAIAYQGYAGTQTDCLVWNGYTPTAVTTTLNYDGTNWSTNPASLALARLNYNNNAGTASAAIVFGGEGPAGPVTTTEEFTGAYDVLDYKTITTS